MFDGSSLSGESGEGDVVQSVMIRHRICGHGMHGCILLLQQQLNSAAVRVRDLRLVDVCCKWITYSHPCNDRFILSRD